MNFSKAANNIINRTDDLSDSLKQRRRSWLVSKSWRIIPLQNSTDNENGNGLNVLVLVSDHHIKLNKTVLDAFLKGFFNLFVHILDVLEPVSLGLLLASRKEFVTINKNLTNLSENVVQLDFDFFSVFLLLLFKLRNQVTFLLVN